MVEAEFGPLFGFPDARHTGNCRDDVASPVTILGAGGVDVGDLVIADGEGPGIERVESLAERARPHRQQARLTQYAVQEDRPGDVAMTVLADDPDASPGRPGRVQQGGTGVIQLADQSRHIATGRAEPLGIVVEVGQVDESQVGPL